MRGSVKVREPRVSETAKTENTGEVKLTSGERCRSEETSEIGFPCERVNPQLDSYLFLGISRKFPFFFSRWPAQRSGPTGQSPAQARSHTRARLEATTIFFRHETNTQADLRVILHLLALVRVLASANFRWSGFLCIAIITCQLQSRAGGTLYDRCS